MALVLKDRVLETCSAPGTGAVTLLGAVTGYQTFSSAIGNANTCYYTIADQNGSNWEVGIGTYATSGNTLTRTTVLSSSNAGSTVNFATGTQNVFVTYPSERSVNLSSSALTSGRVTYATTDGLLTDSANMTFDGTTLIANALKSATLGSPTSTALTIQSVGTTAMTVDTSQNVGIGTTTPVAQLGVYGTGQTTAAMSTSSGLGGTLYVRDAAAAAGNGGAVMFGANQGAFAAIKGLITDGSNNTLGVLAFSNRNASTDTTLTERMRIDSSGNVGIGITNPSQKLQVAGNARLGTGAYLGFPDSGGTFVRFSNGEYIATSGQQLQLCADNSDGTIAFFTTSTGSASNERMRINSSGNVGIGTTSPAQKLQIGGSTANDYIQFGATSSGFVIGRDNSTGYFIQNATQASPYNQFIWQQSGTEIMRIDSSGNVGIGTSSPNASAILDAQSTTKGVRMPNMTTTQKNAISSPAAGLMVFDTTLAKLCVYSGSAWQTITSI